MTFVACNEPYTPKPRGYFHVDFPARSYQAFDKPGYPYSFMYPRYSVAVQDSLFFEEETENPYWINLDFPQFDGRIHLSYKEIGPNRLDSLIDDAYTLSYKQHTYKASGRTEKPFRTAAGIPGVFFTLRGNTATAYQFFVTDSVRHFLRGALYFQATPNEDSLRPMNNFLKADLDKLIETLRWK